MLSRRASRNRLAGVSRLFIQDRVGRCRMGSAAGKRAKRAAWLFVRILTVLCLLQRLRNQPSPPEDKSRRPESLVGAQRLRVAFKLAMEAIYGPGDLAVTLEKSPSYRAAEERARLERRQARRGRSL